MIYPQICLWHDCFNSFTFVLCVGFLSQVLTAEQNWQHYKLQYQFVSMFDELLIDRWKYLELWRHKFVFLAKFFVVKQSREYELRAFSDSNIVTDSDWLTKLKAAGWAALKWSDFILLNYSYLRNMQDHKVDLNSSLILNGLFLIVALLKERFCAWPTFRILSFKARM